MPRLAATVSQLQDAVAHATSPAAHLPTARYAPHRHLARKGWLEDEDESAFLWERAGSDDAMDALRMSSITYRIATGKHAGRKVATLQVLPDDAGALERAAGKVGGFSHPSGGRG